jgi:CheY-like chemotaxis protein
MLALDQDPKKFDLILTDIRMPKRSGSDLIIAVRSNPLLMKIPIIVLTAYGTADVMIECLKEGATGFMVKPPKKKDLKHEIARVRRILRFKLDPRLVFPSEVEKMREILATKGFF